MLHMHMCIYLFSVDGIYVYKCTTHPVSLVGSELRVAVCVCVHVCVHVYWGIGDVGLFGGSQSRQVRVMLGVLSVQC